MDDLIKRADAIKGKQAQTLNANAEFMMGRVCNEDENRMIGTKALTESGGATAQNMEVVDIKPMTSARMRRQ